MTWGNSSMNTLVIGPRRRWRTTRWEDAARRDEEHVNAWNDSDRAGPGAPGAKSIAMASETHLERRLDRLIAHAETPRTAAAVIATVTVTITIAAGALMTFADHKHFPSVGSGLWWAVQTVTTVGYGDHVPETPIGQIVAAVVMLFGIGFVTVITASITGAFVARTRKDERAAGDRLSSTELLHEILERLDRIEATLEDQHS
jgi:voltage-gated potassium channel